MRNARMRFEDSQRGLKARNELLEIITRLQSDAERMNDFGLRMSSAELRGLLSAYAATVNGIAGNIAEHFEFYE